MNRKRPYPSLKEWRDAHRLGQRAAAARLNITQGYYSRLELKRQFPDRRLAKAISIETGVPLESVLGLA